jgi:hypothetical protein
LFVKNGNHGNPAEPGNETLLNDSLCLVSQINRPGNAETGVKEVFGDILQPRQAMPGDLRFEYQQVRILVVRHIMLFFPSAALGRQDG